MFTLYETLITTTVLLVCSQSDSIHCEEENVCAGSNLTTTSSEDPVYCDAWKSCIGSTISSREDLWCSGAFSCFNSHKIFVSDDLRCRGVDSCANINHITVGTQNTGTEPLFECMAANACRNSMLQATNYILLCHAESSCQDSIIVHTPTIVIDAQFAAINSIINSTSIYTNQMTVLLDGYYSGYNLTIICNDGYNCDIICFGITSCIALNVDCKDGSNCQFYNLTDLTLLGNSGDDDTSSIYNYNNISLELILDSIDSIVGRYLSDYSYNAKNIQHFASMEMSDYYNQSCDSDTADSNILICNDDDQCFDQTINSDSYPGGICCTGDESCEDLKFFNYNNTASVLCLGREGCFTTRLDGSDMSSAIDQINQAEVFCSGQDACEFAKIYNFNLVYCNAAQSCQSTQLTNISVVMCAAWFSCVNSTMNDIDLVISTGHHSLDGAVITLNNNSYVYMLNPNFAFFGLSIYCGSGKNCTVVCGVNGACNNTKFYCGQGATCNIVCEFSSIFDTTTCNETKTNIIINTVNSTISHTTTTTNSESNTTMSNGNGNGDASYEKDIRMLSDLYYYVVAVVIGFILIVIIFGYIDANFIRPNEMLHIGSVILCTMYSLDFLSGIKIHCVTTVF